MTGVLPLNALVMPATTVWVAESECEPLPRLTLSDQLPFAATTTVPSTVVAPS